MIIDDFHKYKELFQITEKFHAKLDANLIHIELIQSLIRKFPTLQFYLFLSNDYEKNPDLPISGLEYHSKNNLAISAFVTGRIELDQTSAILYAPLKGRQGVYGVLKVEADDADDLQEDLIDFIGSLANSAGNAIENAKLYQQSQRLVSDLKLIDEISQNLNSTSKLDETIDYLNKQITTLFRPTDIGYIFFKDNGPEILKSSSHFFTGACDDQLIHYLLQQIINNNDSLFIGEIKHMPICLNGKYGSLMAVPMMHGEDLNGVVIVLGKKQYSFTFDMFKLFQSIIQRSTLALANSMLREKLEDMVITDYLTQLYNRSYLNNEIKNSMKTDREGTLILLDLDDFKDINDTYGHQTGDEVLIQVSNIIKSKLRSTDIGARWGGEELAVYLPGVAIDQGYLVAMRLVNQVSEQTKPQVTVSCGVSSWNSEDPIESTVLFSQADNALYKAKGAGKNQVYLYKQS